MHEKPADSPRENAENQNLSYTSSYVDAKRGARMIKTLEELDKVRDDCYRLVTRRSSLSGVASAVPLPGIDVGSDAAILLEMLPAISKRFELSEADIDALDPTTKALVLTTAGSLGSKVIGHSMTRDLVIRLLKKVGVKMASKQLVKYVPFAGQLIAAGIGFTAMKYVGNNHVNACYQVAKAAIEHPDNAGNTALPSA
jgi:uncharacterized protein (DUF697 family)